MATIVRIKLFAGMREAVGADEVTLELPSGSNLGEVRVSLAKLYPLFAPLLDHVRFAINWKFADVDATVCEGDEVAVIPPVSGG